MFDLLIKGAEIIDGKGTPRWKGDAAITDGRFVAVEKTIDAPAARTIQADRLALAPGFIDIHTHSDAYLLENPDAEIKVRQGVVLDVTGNCGMSMAPVAPGQSDAFKTYISSIVAGLKRTVDWQSFGEYVDRVRAARPAINFSSLVGHGAIRIAVMGLARDPASRDQLERMKALTAQAMDQGAVGLSTGLIYPPGCFAETGEIVALSRIVAQTGGIYTSHIRNEAQRVIESLDEAIRIGKESGVPVHVSHLKIMGPQNWPLVDRMIDRMEAARAQGVDLTGDMYPYQASHTSMLTLLPMSSVEGGVKAALDRIRDSRQRPAIRDHVSRGRGKMLGWNKISICRVTSDRNRRMEGRRVSELAREAGKEPADFILDLLESENGSAHILSEGMNEEVQTRFLKLPYVMIGSDGIPSPGKPHPRVYGTFPRVFRRYVRELGVLSLEAAVMKMTSMPAARLGLKHRGAVFPGFAADAVLFDPETIADKATFADPCQFPEGIHLVVVGGKIVLDGPSQTPERPGRRLTPSEP